MLYLLTTCCTTFPREPVKPNQKVTLMEPAGWGTGGIEGLVGAWAIAVEAARSPMPSIVLNARVSSRHAFFACCNVSLLVVFLTSSLISHHESAGRGATS